MDAQFEPPAHLNERAAALWREVVGTRAKSPGRIALVLVALEALTRADAAREAVDREGMTHKTPSTGALHLHPLLRVEREGRQLFAKTWGELGFHYSFQAGDTK